MQRPMCQPCQERHERRIGLGSRQSSFATGTWRFASLTSTVSANVRTSILDFSLIECLGSAAIGALSWSCILVRVPTAIPFALSKTHGQ